MDASTLPSPWLSLLWFAVVVAAIPLALWLLKRSSLGAGFGAAAAATSGLPRTVAVLPLSAQHRIVTVEVGTGSQRRWLVLGVSPQGLARLHELPPGEELPADPAPPPAAAFQQLLGRLRHGRIGDGAR